MGRTHVSPVLAQTEVSCGPACVKNALGVFGIRKSQDALEVLCKTSRNGTSTKNLIGALVKLNFVVLAVENATLHHVMSALKYSPNNPRAVIVNYLYSQKHEDEDWKNSGHWATVSSYSASNGKLVVFDPASGKKKSYLWKEFIHMWKDFDYKRRRVSKVSKKFTLVRKWSRRLLLIVAKDMQNLPDFSIQSQAVYPFSFS